ncbi:hypothetical protein DFJ74DRAFT_641469 [Hyaloraphidium curvatum]|nr:hypothetical protein DFJ74DRAFT_641469 [Hyaloraphidium curvatum]
MIDGRLVRTACVACATQRKRCSPAAGGCARCVRRGVPCVVQPAADADAGAVTRRLRGPRRAGADAAAADAAGPSPAPPPPPVDALLPKALAIYFSRVYPSFLLVHRTTFLDALTGRPSRHYSAPPKALAYAAAAVGLYYGDAGDADADVGTDADGAGADPTPISEREACADRLFAAASDALEAGFAAPGAPQAIGDLEALQTVCHLLWYRLPRGNVAASFQWAARFLPALARLCLDPTSPQSSRPQLRGYGAEPADANEWIASEMRARVWVFFAMVQPHFDYLRAGRNGDGGANPEDGPEDNGNGPLLLDWAAVGTFLPANDIYFDMDSPQEAYELLRCSALGPWKHTTVDLGPFAEFPASPERCCAVVADLAGALYSRRGSIASLSLLLSMLRSHRTRLKAFAASAGISVLKLAAQDPAADSSEQATYRAQAALLEQLASDAMAAVPPDIGRPLAHGHPAPHVALYGSFCPSAKASHMVIGLWISIFSLPLENWLPDDTGAIAPHPGDAATIFASGPVLSALESAALVSTLASEQLRCRPPPCPADLYLPALVAGLRAGTLLSAAAAALPAGPARDAALQGAAEAAGYLAASGIGKSPAGRALAGGAGGPIVGGVDGGAWATFVGGLGGADEALRSVL